jgi:hypothetical protein
MAAADDITDAQVIKTFSFNIKEKRLKKASSNKSIDM